MPGSDGYQVTFADLRFADTHLPSLLVSGSRQGRSQPLRAYVLLDPQLHVQRWLLGRLLTNPDKTTLLTRARQNSDNTCSRCFMLAYLFVVLAVTIRVVAGTGTFATHGFTPVGASLLFFGSRMPRKYFWAAGRTYDRFRSLPELPGLSPALDLGSDHCLGMVCRSVRLRYVA